MSVERRDDEHPKAYSAIPSKRGEVDGVPALAAV
jgi:hypothetical protein